jgi:hypothetical protein
MAWAGYWWAGGWAGLAAPSLSFFFFYIFFFSLSTFLF